MMDTAQSEISGALTWLREQRLTSADWAFVEGQLAALDSALADGDANRVLRVAYELDRLTRRVKTRLGEDPDDDRVEMPRDLRDQANERVDGLLKDPDER
ncbi:CATRA system-associated protein [Actinokineospora sp. 24-640]